MQYSLKDSYLYDLLGLNIIVDEIGLKINPNIENFKVSDDNINQILSDFKNRATGLGREIVISRIKQGKILLINAPNVPLVSWCMNTPNGVIAVCNIFSKSRTDRENRLTYQVKELFGLAMVSYIMRSFYVNEKKFLYNNQLVSNMGAIYVRICMRVIDTMFSVNAIGNERESHILEYLLAKFYLRRLMEKEGTSKDQETANIATIMAKSRSEFKDTLSMNAYIDDAESFPDEVFLSIDSLFKEIANRLTSLNKLETNVFIRKLIMTLGEKGALMLESPQYLYALVASSAYNSNIIKDYQIASVVGTKLLAQVTSGMIGLDPEL
jgi:hypothetical protein